MTPKDLQILKSDALDAVNRYLIINPSEAYHLAFLINQLTMAGNPFVRSNMVGHITASVAILNRTLDKLLLIDHAIIKAWLPPGGHFESLIDRIIWEAALREVLEETGVKGLVLHAWCKENDLPLDIDTHWMAANPQKGEGRHYHHDFRFLATADDTQPLDAQLIEVHDARWVPIPEVFAMKDRRLKVLSRKLRPFVREDLRDLAIA